jgi:hypothetical protein
VEFSNLEKLIDKTVDLDFSLNLGYRACCRYQFFRDYKKLLKTSSDGLVNHNIGYSINGDYHLNITKEFVIVPSKQKAIKILTN